MTFLKDDIFFGYILTLITARNGFFMEILFPC